MLNRRCETFPASKISFSKKCRVWACSLVRGKTLFQTTDKSVKLPSGKSAALVASSEQLSGKFPLNQAVSTSTRRTWPGLPSLIITQSWPGPRRRFRFPTVTHIRRPARHDEIVTMAKNMSLHESTSPPFSTAARSMSPPMRLSRSQSGTTSP